MVVGLSLALTWVLLEDQFHPVTLSMTPSAEVLTILLDATRVQDTPVLADVDLKQRLYALTVTFATLITLLRSKTVLPMKKQKATSLLLQQLKLCRVDLVQLQQYAQIFALEYAHQKSHCE